MRALVLFLVLLSSSCFSYSKYIFGSVFLLVSLVIYFKKIKSLKWGVIYLFSFLLIILLSYLYSIIPNFINTYLIVERKENYVLIFNGIKFYYINIKGDETLDIFDILFIEGNISKLEFSVIESQFDFNEYLFSKGVDEKIDADLIVKKFDFPFSFYFKKVKFLNSIDNTSVRNFVGNLLFSYYDYSDSNYLLIKNLQIISLFSASGIYLNMILYGIKKLFNLHFSEKNSYIFSFFITLFICFININKFITIKVLLLFLLSFINKFYLKERFKRIEIISILGSLFIFIFPRIILQSSFQISFLVSILLFFINKITFSKKKIEKKLIINFFIFLILIPFNLMYSSSINIFSFIISFILLPCTKIIYLINLTSYLFFYSTFIEKINSYFLNFINFFEDAKVIINIPEFNEILVILYYLFIFAIIFFKEINFRKINKLVIPSFISFLILYAFPIENYLTNQVSFINVGQGDATLIRIKDKSYLIDTGGLTYLDVANNSLIPFLKKNRIYELEAVFITHYDYDHYGSLDNLNTNFKVKNIYDYNNFSSFNSDKLNILNLNANYKIDDEENDKSLVLYMKISDKYFLFMGDASSNVEKRIIQSYSKIEVDYLKVGHHGSKSSTCEEFLVAIDPEIAIISCGKNNSYSHPNKETLSRLENYNVEIRRTDIEGTITYKFF